MRLGKWTTAVLGLGLTAAIPTFAKADRVHDDRFRDDHREVRVREDHDRIIHRDVIVDRRPEVIVRDRVIVQDPVILTTNCDYGVAVAQVPGCVMGTFDGRFGGAPIEAVNFVQRDGQTFYRFRIGARQGPLEVRIALNGSLLSVVPAA